MAEDRKFKFENGRFVNRVSGEAIPDDEPVILFRARDRNALEALRYYRSLCEDEHHREAVTDRISEFKSYQDAHPERMKEPGVTRHIQLNSDQGMAAWYERPNAAMAFCIALEAIRTGAEGNSVEILCDNPEADSVGEQTAVDCCCDFTDWKPQRFPGPTPLEAILAAAAEQARSR